ncbi:MAG: DUF5801 repeats-in-toxin domain-containing protein [Alphaproteobacteria bacterium]
MNYPDNHQAGTESQAKNSVDEQSVAESGSVHTIETSLSASSELASSVIETDVSLMKAGHSDIQDTPLTFGQNDIQDVSLGNDGALVIKFSQGGADNTLVIDDFEALANGSVCLALSDGGQIDTQALYTELCNDLGVCTIEKPLAGDLLDVPLDVSQKYDLKFSMEEGQEVAHHHGEVGDALTLTFEDGAQITFQGAQDLVEGALNGDAHASDTDVSEFLSALQVIEGLVARMNALEEQYADAQGQGGDGSAQVAQEMAFLEHDLAMQLAQIEPAADASEDASYEETQEEVYALKSNIEDTHPQEDLAAAAEELAEVEPAAGEGSGGTSVSGGGYGYQSSFDAQGVINIEDVGPIDPTQLQYGIEQRRDDLGLVEEDGERETPPEVNDLPEIFADAKSLDETDGFALSEGGVLNFDFGDDGAGSVGVSGDFSSTGSLAGGDLNSGGYPVSVTATPSGYEGVANGQVVFTFTIDPQTGEYQYNQVLPFDHADGADANDAITLDFGVQVSDSDGDTAQSNVTITVFDDAPISIDAQSNSVDETDMNGGDTSVSGQITANFGQDGAGGITGNGDIPSVALTSNGVPVIITYDTASATYTGTAGGEDVFTLSIASDGTYDFVLEGTLDHPDSNDPNDAIDLEFGIQATDFDGDSIDGSITITVLDDGPIAKDDCVKFDTQDNSVDGNVIANDHLSEDVANTVSSVSFEGNSVDIPDDGSATIDGMFGTLEIYSDGSYTYTLNGTGGTSTSSSHFNPSEADVAGIQESLTKDGITVSVANDGDYDLTWVNTADGSGLGIDNLNAGDSAKVWPKGETFNIDMDQNAQSVTLTIAEIGSNNNQGYHGVDYVITFEDGSTVNAEQQFVPNEIVDGHFSFTIDASDYGDLAIASIDLNSTNEGDYKGASFLLNDVKASYEHDVEVCDSFEYTLTDADGDSDVATLKIKGLDPELIVGENVDDTSKSDTPHHIGGEDGVISGSEAGDILIGDVGGASLEQQTQDYNFVFIVDVSGSMGSASDPTSKISILKDSVEGLLNEFGSYQNGDIKVHITPFATDVKPSGTFSVTDSSGLTDALAYLETLTGSGYTNYESPLIEANTWLQSGDPIGGDAITTTYFISDGHPNKYIDDLGNIRYDSSGNTVMEEITGSDGSDDVGLLQGLSDDVIAVGINASDSIMSRLDVVDSDGDALNIDDPSDLSVVFKDTSPLNNLADVGDDVIEGGSGDDVIFGDSVNTDSLADDHGLNTTDGAGWQVFDDLEDGQSASDPDWSRDETVDYIRNHADELAEESTDDSGDGRQGGDDMLYGGAGDDQIYGQEGDDIIDGGSGDDVISGGSGADTFVQNAVNQGVDVIRDFSAGEGDVLDLAGLIQNYDPTQQAIDDFIFSRDVNGGTVLSVDVSGSGDANNAVDLVALEGLQNMDVQALVESGNINVF